MSGDVRVLNRQRGRAVDTRFLRRMARTLLAEVMALEEFDLTVQLVGRRAMAKANKVHLNHEGPTDVITLDYAADTTANGLAGEIIVCVDVAVEQARQFRAAWQKELARYVVHGILHLRGHDDRNAAGRRRMKREEARLLKDLGKRFHLRNLAGERRLTA